MKLQFTPLKSILKVLEDFREILENFWNVYNFFEKHCSLSQMLQFKNMLLTHKLKL